MEVSKLARQGEEGTCVYQDVEWWSKLALEICNMILEKLPTLERLRLRTVCKDKNCNVLQRLERKPYFVTIFRSTISSHYLSGLIVYDVVSKSLSFEPLPLKLHNTDHFSFGLAPFAVEGLIFMNQPRARLRRKSWSVDVHKNQWCVYSIHTRTTHLLPQAPSLCGACRSSKYMSTAFAMDGVFVYSMEEDQWSRLSGSPFRGKKQTYLGVWDDRIFAVLHDDAGAKSVTVWELIDATQQEWVEYARCSKAQYELLMRHDKCVEDCYGQILSVFSKEYVLMYNWHTGRSYALVLLNLKTREWEPVASIPNMIDQTVSEEESFECEHY